MSFAGNLLDVVAVGFCGRNAPGGSVRLVQKPGVGQVGHDIANGGRTESLAVGTREHARPYRLTCGNKGLHDGGQDFAFSVSDWARGFHKYLVSLSDSGGKGLVAASLSHH